MYKQKRSFSSSCRILVYSVQRSSVAMIELSGIDVFSMKRRKSVGSLIYDSSFLTIGCRSVSMELEMRSVSSVFLNIQFTDNQFDFVSRCVNKRLIAKWRICSKRE